ncbi:hypothetical protein [Desulfosporosinus sp. Sb-LF]|uniref:hypothetical protein n=1 Tax=Desulfosporosinus sp. Sb-LF TaxID=2560027 RepID=UPI00107EE987|nr:hypothetical protein [Desulfosporosinus sp. Sb-LF]TGE31314.1 hypothetical protein E4K68_17820 [Desulfosporosinus sp. Sb-LF]
MIDVSKLLVNYHETKRSLGLLEFKIKNYEMYRISTERTIEEMTFSSPQGERVSNSGITDKTARIALKYQGVTDANNDEHLEELKWQYKTQKYEIDTLDLCISLLEKEQSNIVTDLAINGMNFVETGAKYYMSKTSVRRRYKKAILELGKMYQNHIPNSSTQQTG